jgi:hypothetical protein
MPACQIEDYQDTPQARAELIPWLVATEPRPLSAETWGKRLAHWWDQNPFASLRNERGWVLRHEGRIVGFMALIPACYAVNGRPVAALIASSWRIDEAHRNASLPMLMKLRRLAADTLIADTTPTPEVQTLLQRSDWTGLTDIQTPLRAARLGRQSPSASLLACSASKTPHHTRSSGSSMRRRILHVCHQCRKVDHAGIPALVRRRSNAEA